MRPHAAPSLAVVVLVSVLLASCVSGSAASVDLGTAGSFAVLAGSGITNTGPTTVNGDVGSFPTTTQTGFGPGADSVTFTGDGVNHFGDDVTQGAKDDLVTAYDAAANRTPTATIAADLGGQTLTPGTYNSGSSVGLTGTLTLNAEGDADAVFIFQAGSTLTTASDSSVVLINGARSCNVFWQVGSSATLGTRTHLEGTILALTSITLTTGATIEGRALARNGAVTMDANAIEVVPCGAPEETSPTGPTTTIPFYPSAAAVAIACLGGLAGAFLILRKRA